MPSDTFHISLSCRIPCLYREPHVRPLSIKLSGDIAGFLADFSFEAAFCFLDRFIIRQFVKLANRLEVNIMEVDALAVWCNVI